MHILIVIKLQEKIGKLLDAFWVGMAMGRGGTGSKDGVFVLVPHGFVLPLARMMGKTFSPHPYPLKPCEALPHPIKLYFLLICLQLVQFFLMKLISLIKIYLKLQLNLSHKIKSIFRKIELYIQVFNKTIIKWKSHSITHNKIKAEIHIR